MNIPAFCDNCGAIFKSGFQFENCMNVSLRGNKSGPCPSCGSMGHIPDGVFNFIDDSIELLSGPSVTREELEKLKLIIQDSFRNRQDNESIENRLRVLPKLSPLLDVLPKNRIELYQFLALLIVIIQMLMTVVPEDSRVTNIENTNNYFSSQEVVNKIYNDYTIIINQYIFNNQNILFIEDNKDRKNDELSKWE